TRTRQGVARLWVRARMAAIMDGPGGRGFRAGGAAGGSERGVERDGRDRGERVWRSRVSRGADAVVGIRGVSQQPQARAEILRQQPGWRRGVAVRHGARTAMGESGTGVGDARAMKRRPQNWRNPVVDTGLFSAKGLVLRAAVVAVGYAVAHASGL